MKSTKKLVYSAAMTALSVAGIAISRFFPLLSFTPLMLSALCFFIALECGWRYGVLTIAATLILGFFIAGLSGAFFLCALVFAPYSLAAKLLKRFEYNSSKNAAVRIVSITILFNLLLLIIVFALGEFIDELIFSYTLEGILSLFGGAGYLILALIGTAFMVGFDFVFSGISRIVITKYLRIKGDMSDQNL